jgi:hypothetical protein
MRILNFLLALMFLVFAFLQVNDPDPAIWILIYGAMSVVCVMAIFEYYNRKLLIALAMLYSVYCYFLWPGVSEWLQHEDKSVLFNEMNVDYPFIEESREFLGLIISIVVVLFYLIRSYRSKSA